MKVEKVVISGEMPESCQECCFHDGVGWAGTGIGEPLIYFANCKLARKQHEWREDKPTRPDWCPLEGKIVYGNELYTESEDE